MVVEVVHITVPSLSQERVLFSRMDVEKDDIYIDVLDGDPDIGSIVKLVAKLKKVMIFDEREILLSFLLLFSLLLLFVCLLASLWWW